MPESNAIRRDLAALLGAEAVRWSEDTLLEHAHDTWPLSLLHLQQGALTQRPACVASPASTADVQALLRYAHEHTVPVVPYGAGSGVCGGVLPDATSIVVDLRRMNALLEVNSISLFARAQAGMMGDALETQLNAQGFSTGHFPQSIDISTVGGWVATRSAGQSSTRYGSIEDMVAALEVVLADGTVVQTRNAPRAATGPDLRQIFLGSEGTLGIVTEVTLKIHPLPECRQLASYRFPTMAAGLDAIRTFVREGWRPPVVRLYDGHEATRNFPDAGTNGDCLLLLLSEGPTALTAAEMAACDAHCTRAGGAPLGAGPVEHWIEHRNQVPSLSDLIARGFVLDTIEVAASWDRIQGVYDDVVAALRGVPSVFLASGHSSHSYAQGTNIYFTFVAKPDDPSRAEATYLDCWRATMRATVARGGTISHHHGIGRSRVEWMEAEHGAGVQVLRALKRALDPKGILNPGVLLPR